MQHAETISILPFNPEQKQVVEQLFHQFDDRQLIWLAGYLTGISLPQSMKHVPVEGPATSTTVPAAEASQRLETVELSILYGSRTGNGASIAKKAKAEAEAKGFKVHLFDTNDYTLSRLKEEKNLLVIVSTHGDGVPPAAAEEFYNYLFGKRAPKLAGTKYSVLALGDSSYVQFCKAGRDIDARLEELGASRIFERADCDVDYEETSIAWINGVLSKWESSTSTASTMNGKDLKRASANDPSAYKVAYSRQKPFKAKLLEKVLLNGRGSSKETWHYEISLEGSGLVYEPGDALGVFAYNSQRAVDEILQLLKATSEEIIDFDGKKLPIGQVLVKNVEISAITSDVLKKYNELAQHEELTQILAHTEKLKTFLYGRDIVDLMTAYPIDNLGADSLVKILRKLQPRLYSISSSPNAHPGEVHLTVAAVRYTQDRYKEGVCSTFLADRIGEDEYLHVFVEKNPEFRLPRDPEAPVIMVGPGTGVAPFRAFIEERELSDARGKNWLFFGDQHFTTDFLYQTEWQNFQKRGVLTRLNVAFSRDTEQKVYVQHKMKQHANELFKWLEDGGYFYVCGDMKHMWSDVHNTLIAIVQAEGKLSREDAEAYVQKLKKSKRYQVDVY